jgi:hypothetical protein
LSHPPQISGWDVFQKKSLDLVLILKDYYLTFVDVYEWREATWALLEEAGKNMSDLSFDANQEVMTLYFDLFVGFVQMHIMLQKIKERRLLLTAYARAYQVCQGNSEPNFPKYVTQNQSGSGMADNPIFVFHTHLPLQTAFE